MQIRDILLNGKSPIEDRTMKEPNKAITTPFQFGHQNLDHSEWLRERFFAIMPGLISWTILITLTVLSFTRPLIAAGLIIAIYIFWLLRFSYMTLFLILAYGVLACDQAVDWVERSRHLEEGEAGLKKIREQLAALFKAKSFRRWISLRNHHRELKRVIIKKTAIPAFDSIYHLVIIAAAKEPRSVLEPGIRSMMGGQFPASRIIPVLAIEARAGEKHQKMAESLQDKFQESFYGFLVVAHPDGLSGEAKVKGANVTFAARRAAAYLEEKKIPFENVIVSCFDADTVASPSYFGALTYHYMRHPNRMRASYQPIPVYHNNIWDAPAVARVLEMGSSFFQLIEATNPEKLVTFSSHSMSFKALVEIGYWPVDMISDDSAIFWKALIHYRGDYRVVPMYVTLSMDVVMAGSILQTFATIYRQKRRWAWGVENFPVVMRAFMRERDIPLIQKFRYTVKLLEMHISWATLGFVMTFIGWLPALFAGQEFSSSVMYYNSAKITGLIFNLAFSFLIVSIVLSWLLLPKRPTKNPFLKRLILAFEWLFVPLVFTFFSTLPALDAQTRLMRGEAMEFQITEKKRRIRVR